MKLTPKTYTTRNEKVLDFAIGFVGWYILNGLMYGGSLLFLTNGGLDTSTSLLANLLLVAPLLVNIAALIYFAFARRWIALGALAAFGLLLVGVLIVGIFLYAVCFNMGNL